MISQLTGQNNLSNHQSQQISRDNHYHGNSVIEEENPNRMRSSCSGNGAEWSSIVESDVYLEMTGPPKVLKKPLAPLPPTARNVSETRPLPPKPKISNEQLSRTLSSANHPSNPTSPSRVNSPPLRTTATTSQTLPGNKPVLAPKPQRSASLLSPTGANTSTHPPPVPTRSRTDLTTERPRLPVRKQPLEGDSLSARSTSVSPSSMKPSVRPVGSVFSDRPRMPSSELSEKMREVSPSSLSWARSESMASMASNSNVSLHTKKMNKEEFLVQVKLLTDTGDPRSFLRLVTKMDVDSTASLSSAIDTRSTNPSHMASRVVIKKTNIANTPRLQTVYNEVAILRNFPHKHIVELYGAYLVESELWIIMEMAERGTLTTLIKKERSLSEPRIADITSDILKALSFLHGHGVIHRDIRSDSILIMTNGSAKLSDFNLSAQVYPDIPKRHTLVGSPYWMAPEVIARWPYDTAVDIWAMGITILEMINGEPPNFNRRPCDVMTLVRDTREPKIHVNRTISEHLRAFLTLMLVYDAEYRGTADQLLESTFMQNAKSECRKIRLHKK